MSNADMRTQLATAAGTVDGVTGYPIRPAVVQPGDAWPLWRGAARDDSGVAFTNTWMLVVVVASDDQTRNDMADTFGYALVDALDDVLFVDTLEPATIPTSAGDLYGLSITGRSE